MKYSDLTNSSELNVKQMFDIKGGYATKSYGCDSNVCQINRSGAAKECSTAYCRSYMGPQKPEPEICKLFQTL